MKNSSSRTFVAVLAVVGCLTSDGRAQDSRGCVVPSNIHDFCDGRRTISSIVKFRQIERWIKEKNPGSEHSSDRARVTISCDHDADEADNKTRDDKSSQGQSGGMTMFLWHQTVGTVGLAYSKMLPNGAGLIFSMVPFDRASRRAASGTTPGTFALLNTCELLWGRVNGLIFGASQIVPLSFSGEIDGDSSDWDQSGTASARPSTKGPSDQEVAISTTDSAATSTTGTMSKVNPWGFSGIYEFDMEDEDCLIKKGLMKDYEQRTPIERLGHITSDARTRTRQQQIEQPSRYWEKVCPHRKALLVVDAVASDTPIYNLDHGSFVSHHVIGPSWDASQTRFYSVTPNGDTTGPHLGMFKIDGEISPDGSLDFFIFKPHLGKTGRLWPVVGLPKVWMTVDRFHAVKKLDVYCYLHIRPDKDCISWKHQDWDGYLHEVWKHRSIVRPLGLR